jgi:vancomycin resistance protein YoaR
MSRRPPAVTEASRPSPTRERAPRPRRPRRRPARDTSRQLVRLGLIPVLALAGLVLFELANWDKITPGVSALGTTVGGLSRTEAVARLKPAVQTLLARPLDISSGEGGKTWHTTARDLGLRLDPDELARAAYQVGRAGSPFDRLGAQLDALARGQSLSVSSTTDAAALDAALGSMAREIDRAPTDASLSLAADGTLQSSNAQAGLSVDVPKSREQITAALSHGAESVTLVTQLVPPSIPDEQLQAARDELGRLLPPDAPALTLTFADVSFPLQHADIVKLISLSGGTKPGEPAVVNVDDKALRKWAAQLAKDVDQTVQEPRFAFKGGSLRVVRPSKQGRTLDQDALVGLVHAALLSGAQTLELPVKTVDPSVSSDDPQSLGIVELIDRGSTSFAGSIPEKKHNIQLAAQRLNGIVVAPGATFSFNTAIGPTTIDAGFEWGFGITAGNDGPRTVPSVAGGICQVATTLFQPVFWSGIQLEERYWHMYWIPAYTSRGVVGLDVTVDSDSGLDFKWTNNTGNYILVQSDSDDSNVYFGLYGKKPSWKVQVDDAIITNRTPPDTKPLAQEEPTLSWGRSLLVETARDGFDAEVIRHVIPADGSRSRDLDLRSSYQPARTITLVGSAGKPANASLDDALQKAIDAQKPAEAKPSPTAAANPTPAAPASAAAAPTAQPQVTASASKGSTPTAIPRNQPVGPTPKPQPTTKAAANGIAPTPTPGH